MYIQIDTDDYTLEFIKRYLDDEAKFTSSKGNPIEINRYLKEIQDDLKLCNEDHIAKYIQDNFPDGKPQYKRFLKYTLYWHIVTNTVKMLRGNHCQMDFSHDNSNLETHHGDYKTLHGREVQNIDMLVCLCEDCHNSFHQREWGYHKPQIATVEIQTVTKIVEINQVPTDASADVIQNYILYRLSAMEYDLLQKK